MYSIIKEFDRVRFTHTFQAQMDIRQVMRRRIKPQLFFNTAVIIYFQLEEHLESADFRRNFHKLWSN